ncbi:MAG: response regulator [Verrucomicrobiaceae bacterium]|nr:MAG: response regulator [Verrucomicrobiaceae bacterium]
MNAVNIAHDDELEETTACGAAPEFQSNMHSESSPQPLRILFVDDESSLREAVAECLRDEGHTVGTAVDGVHGLEVFCSGTWDVVLVDRAMPRMNGFELALAIKQRNPHMPVVMVSGLPGVTTGNEGLASPVDVIVRKPFRVDHLHNSMKHAIRLHEDH